MADSQIQAVAGEARTGDAKASQAQGADGPQSCGRVQEIPTGKINWMENDRTTVDPERLAELTQSVKTYGVKQAIGVTPQGDGYLGIWGNRRWKAAQAAGLATIPASIQVGPITDALAAELRFLENHQRENLNPIDGAMALDRVIKRSGASASEAAARLGMTPSAASKSLRLLQLSSPIQELVKRGLIPASAAYELTRVDDADRQAELAALLVNGGLTRDGLAGAIKTGKRKNSAASGQKTSRLKALLGNGRSVTVFGPGLDMDGLAASLEELQAKVRKARRQGIEQLATLARMLREQAKS